MRRDSGFYFGLGFVLGFVIGGLFMLLLVKAGGGQFT